MTQTFAEIGPDTGKPFAGNRLACQNCHLDAGLKRSAVPLIGVDKSLSEILGPQRPRHHAAERIDECMTRSMNGRPLPRARARWRPSSPTSDRSTARRRPGIPPRLEPPAPADAGRGAEVYARICAVCHQPHGLGKRVGMGYQFPPLWGPDSFNDGAGMDHFHRAVGFIQQQHAARRRPGASPAHLAGGLGRRRFPAV